MPEPETHLDVKLIAYVHHSLNHVLLCCQKFMVPEKRFDFLVEAWCICLEFILLLPKGYAFVMGADGRYSLLLFDVLLRAVEGLPIKDSQEKKTRKEPATSSKDKMQDEVRLVALRCLIIAIPLDDQDHPKSTDNTNDALLDIEREADSIGLRVKEVADKSKERELWNRLMEPSNESIIAQMIIILLDVAKDSSLVILRITALDGVLKVLRCLKTPQRVAKWLPGIAGGLTKTMRERGLKEHHSVLVKALKAWTWTLITVFKAVVHVEQPVEEAVSKGSSLGETLMEMYKAKASSGSVSQSTPGAVQEQSSGGYGTEEWMKKTEGSLRKLFHELLFLRRHSHWMVRLEFGRLAFSVLKECQGSIAHRTAGSYSSGFVSFLLETLIGCTQDEYNEVCGPARMFLEHISTEFRSMDLISVGKEIMREKLIALPRILHGADETVKQNSIRISQGLVLFLGAQVRSIINHQNIVSYVQSWISILAVEQLDQHNMDDRGGILDTTSDVSGDNPNNESERWRAWVRSRKGPDRKFGFPRRIHLHLSEHLTASLFMTFLQQIGSTTEISTWVDELVSHLQQDCRGVRERQGWFDTGSVSCVLLANQLLLGASRIGSMSYGDSTATTPGSKGYRKLQRHVRRVAKGILEEYLAVMAECSQMALDAKSWQEIHQRSSSSTVTKSNAKKASLEMLSGMSDDEFDNVQSEARVYDFNTDEMLQCLLLEGVASVAVVLGGPEFELELVHVLYVLLERLGDQDSALVRHTAEATLEHVAFVCGHDSVGELVQANYDYVIQQVSQKIAFLSSNPKTPQVLWALIHVVGLPAIAMLEDSVTEIFDALDHWRNQDDQVGEGLLKSLREIVRVMAQASSSSTSRPDESKRDSGVVMARKPGFSPQDKPSVEVTQFVKTYRIMIQGADTDSEAEKLKKDTENMTPEEIRDYFTKLAQDAKDEEKALFGEREDEHANGDSEEEDPTGGLPTKMPKPSKEEPPVPPTKHQALCLRILDKAGYFLAASSPRLRILALEIIQSSIVVLKDRPLELNPVLHALWPSMVGRVLKRSDQDVFYVSLRAIEVVTLLAENCSDFMRRHLLDDIWPFVEKALQAWTRKSEPKGGKTHEPRPITSSQGQRQRPRGRPSASKVFTIEHRLQMTTLESVGKIVQALQIPVQQIWEVLLLARDLMLDWNHVHHWEVRKAASEVVRSMAMAGHGDCVFVALDEALQQPKGEDDGSEESGKQMCRDILAFMDQEVL
ncbi:hypothetical protein B0O80DRAFT_106089 [Mortierella sp. GBAus27b]|nr:hypothetical protein B0O80DRAFT_106089 [Mortierella sp. GBAus27b]